VEVVENLQDVQELQDPHPLDMDNQVDQVVVQVVEDVTQSVMGIRLLLVLLKVKTVEKVLYLQLVQVVVAAELVEQEKLGQDP
tara:strand:- start:227 stop:475 length:249 start_codon:yes stop_codon:yes gene_type:complete